MDRREAVLARLLVIAQGIGGIVKAERNREDVSGKARPAIIIWDGDETADDQGDLPVSKLPLAPRRVSMTPDIRVLAGAKSDDIGTVLNGFRAAMLTAILGDDVLIGIVQADRQHGGTGSIVYDGCTSSLARGAAVEGEMGLLISFHYVLKPSEL